MRRLPLLFLAFAAAGVGERFPVALAVLPRFGADCFHCHGGPAFRSISFANNGLDAVFVDTSRQEATGKASDAGKFPVPSLRAVSQTAPCMHDGWFTTLEQVVEHYSSGVKPSATLDPNLAKHRRG